MMLALLPAGALAGVQTPCRSRYLPVLESRAEHPAPACAASTSAATSLAHPRSYGNVIDPASFPDFEGFMAAVEQEWQEEWERVFAADPRGGRLGRGGAPGAGADPSSAHCFPLPSELDMRSCLLAAWAAAPTLGCLTPP